MHPFKKIGFRFAFKGLLLANGYNMRIHVISAIAVAILVVAYGITGAYLGVLIVSATLVIAMEIMNTAVEKLCDLVVQTHDLGIDSRVRDIKDLAAAAVLVAAIGAMMNGLHIFVPLLV